LLGTSGAVRIIVCKETQSPGQDFFERSGAQSLQGISHGTSSLAAATASAGNEAHAAMAFAAGASTDAAVSAMLMINLAMIAAGRIWISSLVHHP